MDELTEPRTVSRLLANARAYWLGYGAQTQQRSSYLLYRSGVADAQLNGVISFEGGVVADRLREIEQTLTGVPWLWWVGPDSDDRTATDLFRHGYREVGAMPVMAIRLNNLRSTPPPAGLEIRQVTDTAALDAWVRCYTTAFRATAPHDEITRLESVRTGTPDTLIRYSGYLDGHIVGTAALFATEDAAGVYVVSTLEEFRGRGIGTALTAAALREGQRMGLTTGTLQASSMGGPVYARMGFREVTRYRLLMKG